MRMVSSIVVCALATTTSFSAQAQTTAMQDQLAYLAAKINSELPVKNGPMTITRVDVSASVMTYHVALPAKLKGRYANVNVVEDFRNTICNSRDGASLVEAGATIRLDAERSGGDPVVYDVNQAACRMAAASAAAQAPDSSSLRELAETAVRLRLVDPDSAQFNFPWGFVQGSWKPMLQPRVYGWVTCGTVNAKNRMGGYNGPEAFVVVIQNGDVKYVDIDGPTDRYRLVATSCQNSSSIFEGR